MHLFQGNQQVGDDQRVVFNIGPAHVQEPGNVVQGRQEKAVEFVNDQPLSQPGKLGFPGFSHQILPQGDDGRGGNGRPVFPQGVQQIRNRVDDGPGDGFPEVPNGFHGLTEAVYGYAGFVYAQRSNPLRDGHLLRHTHLVKNDSRAFQLAVGLDEITRVGPQAGMVCRDHHIPGFTGETGQPFHLFPPRSKVLAGVRITSSQDDNIQMILPHESPQGLYSLVID